MYIGGESRCQTEHEECCIRTGRDRGREKERITYHQICFNPLFLTHTFLYVRFKPRTFASNFHEMVRVRKFLFLNAIYSQWLETGNTFFRLFFMQIKIIHANCSVPVRGDRHVFNSFHFPSIVRGRFFLFVKFIFYQERVIPHRQHACGKSHYSCVCRRPAKLFN